MTVGPQRVAHLDLRRQQHVGKIGQVGISGRTEKREVQSLVIAEVGLAGGLQPDPNVRRGDREHLVRQLVRPGGEDVCAGRHEAGRDEEPGALYRRQRPPPGRYLDGDRRQPEQPAPPVLRTGQVVGFTHSRPTLIADFVLALPMTATKPPDSRANSHPNSTLTLDTSMVRSLVVSSPAKAATPPSSESRSGVRAATSSSPPSRATGTER